MCFAGVSRSRTAGDGRDCGGRGRAVAGADGRSSLHRYRGCYPMRPSSCTSLRSRQQLLGGDRDALRGRSRRGRSPRPPTSRPCRRPPPGSRTGGPRGRRTGRELATATEKQSPGGGRRCAGSTTVSMAAAAAEAAEDEPRASMMAAPRFCTVVMKSPCSHSCVGDDLGRRLAADAGVGEVGELGGRVVAPDGHVGDGGHRHARLARPAGPWPGSRRGGSWRTSGRRGPRARWSGRSGSWCCRGCRRRGCARRRRRSRRWPGPGA